MGNPLVTLWRRVLLNYHTCRWLGWSMWRSVKEGIKEGLRQPYLLLLAAVTIAAPAYSQPASPAPGPSPAPAPPGITVSLHTGVLSVLTRGQKREFAAARLTVNAPLPDGWTISGRADLTGEQDGGSLDYTDPSTFRSLEGAVTVRRKVGPLELAGIGGVTWSVEGTDGAPADPRLYTAAVGVRAPILEDGYVYAAAGLHQPVGGGALLVSAVVPVSETAATFVDFALPFESSALALKTWTLKIGASVRVKQLVIRP